MMKGACRNINELIVDWRTVCNEKNFIGIGSTRKAFRAGEYVVKVHLHPVGFAQSQNELNVYKQMSERGHEHLFAEIYHVDESLCIQKYHRPFKIKANQSFDVDVDRDSKVIPTGYAHILMILDKEFDGFDLKDSDNYGLNEEGKLVLIDYGMTKRLYEDQWAPLAEAGVLPQIDFDHCEMCGALKELRMYGEKDPDKRCYSCGKE